MKDKYDSIIIGAGQAGYFNSRTIMDNDRLPEHLIIIGGGYIGPVTGYMMNANGLAQQLTSCRISNLS